MDIGSKLKNSRTKAGMTQELVAEKIGVSRQTISNWENNKSYPDIVSVIHLSDLYAVSLDELLKGDEKMMEHLDNTTNEVKSRQKFAKLIQVIAYLVIWAMCLIWFWLGQGSDDAMGYSLLVFFLILPVSTFVISLMIGKDTGWGKSKWLMLLFFGAMYSLADYGTFSLANTLTFGNVHYPELETAIPGLVISAIGMGIGSIVQMMKRKKITQELQSES